MKRILKRWLARLLVLVMLLGAAHVPARAAGKTENSGKKRYIALVLDISGTADFLNNGRKIYTADSAIEDVKKSAGAFLSDLETAAGNNWVCLISFDSTARLISDFTQDYVSVQRSLQGLSSSDVNRSIGEGLKKANEVLQNADPEAEKSVILVTTGMTNGGDSSYSGRYGTSTVGSNWYRIDTGVKLFAYANSAIEQADLIKEYATIYVLGLFQTMDGIPEAGRNVAEFFRLTARDLASDENSFYEVEDPDYLEFAFGEITDSFTAQQGLFKYAKEIDKDKEPLAEAEYYYSDSYFTRRSTYYNASLSTMSLCLELSSYSIPDEVTRNWYDPDLTPDDPAFWNDKLGNVKTLLLGSPTQEEGYEGLGFTDFWACDCWKAAPGTDTIGVCFAHREIKGNDGKTYSLIAVVVRGGGYGAEWASNFTMGWSGNHQGFSEARDEVLNKLSEYVNDHAKELSGNLKLWITGYSRGAITANMVAGALDDGHAVGSYGSVPMEHIYCYAFEPPQGMLKQNMTGDYRNIFNRVNSNDLVPLVAPSAWGFARYNTSSDKLFPSLYTTETKKFLQQYDAMMDQLDEMGFGNFEYKITELWTYDELHIDWSKFLPGGDPLFWTETQTVDTYTALTEGLDMIAKDLLKTRERYQTSIEPSLRDILAILLDYGGAGSGAAKYLLNLPVREFFVQLAKVFEPGTAWYIIQPIFSLNIFFSRDDRIRAVRGRLAEKMSAGLGDLVQLDNLLETFVDIIWEFVKQAFIEDPIFHGNVDTYNKLVLFAYAVGASAFQPHYPEITLAWCRSLDPNYNADLAEELSTITRRVRINCPVDVKVFDADGLTVASITAGVPDELENGLICYVNANGEKVFYLPGDGEYRMEIEATDGGHVNLTLEECDMSAGNVDRVQSYYEIEVQKGDLMNFYVPAIADKELKEHSNYGSSTYYDLYRNGDWIPDDDQIYGEEWIRENSYYTVEADSEGGGTVSGSGRFLGGTFAQLEAWPNPGAEFTGWYRNGVLVWEEPVWRFAVYGDDALTARFTEMPTVEVHFEEAKGGSINMPDGAYPLGSILELEAVPKDGYRFVKWKVKEGGELADDRAVTTELKLTGQPAEGLSVSAVFEKVESTTEASGRSIGSEELGKWGLWTAVGTAGLAGVIGGALYLSRDKRKKRD